MKAKKYLFVAALLCGSVLGTANAQTKAVAELPVAVIQADGALKIKAYKNCKILVYSLLGSLVFEKKNAQPAEEIQLNVAKGCYIVKANEFVQKVIVK